jgi:Rhodopirellula transposase DDE domain
MAADERERLESALTRRWLDLRERLDERSRRLWLAAEARALGYGGIAFVAAVTKVADVTIRDGIKELDGQEPDSGRIRRPGGGRRRAEEVDPGLAAALDALVEPVTRGDPESPLRWTSKHLGGWVDRWGASGQWWHGPAAAGGGGVQLAGQRQDHRGSRSPDRDAQFHHLNTQVKAQIAAGRPVISVDTKKKELVGEYKNGGKEWQPAGEPERVKIHDFVDKKLGKANPYGVYDVGANTGWVSVGTDHDTAGFAVNTIASWWAKVGAAAYLGATELLITADCGGSNGNRVRLSGESWGSE